MSRYKILDQKGLNYLTITTVGWIDVFTRQRYRDIIIESLKYCQEKKAYEYVVTS
jgi:putative transposase